MAAEAKVQSLMRALKERLQKRLPSTWVFAESSDAQGARLLVSQDATPAAGEQVIAIRIKAQDTQFRDAIGMAQPVYTPCVAQVIEEASTIANVSLIQLANRLAVDTELARLSIKCERFMNSNTTAVALTQFQADGSVSGSTLVAVISPDLKWPLAGQ